jgi:hypothetical protein
MKEGQQKPQKSKAKATKSNTRKKLEVAYKDSWEKIPGVVSCAMCGKRDNKEAFSRHHPAGRRKAAFCFTFQVCEIPCHKEIHENPSKATLLGLLWTGRNSKELTHADAETLINRCPFPPSYAINLL